MTAVKLTPAVFVLYFLLRKDFRAAVVSVLSFAVFTAIGFALTWSDSVKYWTETIVDSDRIGGPKDTARRAAEAAHAAAATAICTPCPVRRECVTHAVAAETWMIWGGPPPRRTGDGM